VSTIGGGGVSPARMRGVEALGNLSGPSRLIGGAQTALLWLGNDGG
jgi:hypothetical protein